MAITVPRCQGGNINVRSFAVFRVKKAIPNHTVFTHRLGNSALPVSSVPISAKARAIGDGYEAMNDVQDARMAYVRSLELNPGNEHAKGELVKLRK
jgi:hypothetical protein